MKKVKIGKISAGKNCPLLLIAGPCVIENEKSAFQTAEKLARIAGKLNMPFVFKASYDKANRTSVKGFRGPGIDKGLKILSGIRKRFGVPVITDVHCRYDVKRVAEAVDVVQIPAFLSRQTDFILSAASEARCVNVKKAQFMSPYDMKYVIEKIESAGNKNILVTERGSSFGYNQLVADMRSIPIMRALGYPVIFDVTHSLQAPGGLGDRSGGNSEFAPYLAKAGVACGCDGIFIETHFRPDKALSDGPNSLKLDKLGKLLEQLLEIHDIVKG